MKRYFFAKAIRYQRRNVLNMFSNTMIVTLKGVTICVLFSNDSMYFFSIFYSSSLRTYKKPFYYCNLTIVPITALKFKTRKHIKTKISSAVL